MKNLYLAIALAFLVSGFADAKVSTFTNEQVLNHVMQSRDFAKLKQGRQLSGLELASVSIEQTGGPGIGTDYRVAFSYHHVGGMLTVCSFDATVENVRDPRTPSGITASKLSDPSFSRVNCAY